MKRELFLKIIGTITFCTFLCSCSNTTKNVTGTIYFFNGTSLKFSNLQSVKGKTENYLEWEPGSLSINNEGAWTSMKLKDIREIRVIEFNNSTIHEGSTYTFDAYNVTLNILTKNGVKSSSKYNVITGVYINYYNNQKGEEVENYRVDIGRPSNQINIERIVID
jgi:hypothetical protein